MPSKKKTITFSETKKEISKGISENKHLPDELKEKLTDTIYSKVEEILERLPIKPKAIIWSGGFPRGEATYVQGTLLNDLDLFVLGSFNPFLIKLKNLEEWRDLGKQKVKVSISVGPPASLKKHKTITNLELKTGKVIYGDKKIKENIKATPDNLSKFEGLRMLFTGLSALQDTDRPELELKHLTAKTYIACADSYLLLNDKYVPSYSERKELMEKTKLPEALKNKGRKSYEFKISKRKEVDLSLEEAKQELLVAIDNYLKNFVKEGNDSFEKLELLEEKAPVNFLLNLYYYNKLRKEFTPKFFKVVFDFNIVKLYLALLYYENGNKQAAEKVLSDIVEENKQENLLKIIHLAPNPSTIELY